VMVVFGVRRMGPPSDVFNDEEDVEDVDEVLEDDAEGPATERVGWRPRVITRSGRCE
jgi:hypothetical protein